MEIKAILFGVDESVIGNLDIGENYRVERDWFYCNWLC